ncbi:MAG: BMP family ABC transporter substrate-binding protein [Oscillospiraceae bacterium]|nr:BMP family ABC transporter substrate-binding protein [Oscillospiraceae bacterium]
MKKLFAILLSVILVAAITACAAEPAPAPDTAPPAEPAPAEGLTFETVRLAFIHVGDTADQGYTYRQHRGTTDMQAALGVSDAQVLNFWNIPPGDQVDTSILEAIEWGADMIFATSFGHGPHLHEAAQVHPDVQFFHATGNLAAGSGLANFHNYFGNMSQARFLSGIAAGLKTQSNVLGFVAAHPNAEVITGLTAFFMGAQYVNPDVTMYVMFMNAWNNPTLEGQIAQALIDRGADVLGQHADSPTTQLVAEQNGVWAVGYNNDMIPMAPNATLLSPMFDWSYYLIQAVEAVVAGRDMQPDFLAGLAEGMVFLSDLNEALVAPGTAEAIAEAEARILGGWNVFTGPIYDNDGNQLLADGEEFIEPLSAPSWTHIIRGITVIE